MEVNKIHELIAQKLQKDLNEISGITEFNIKTSYNYQEPDDGKPNVMNGVINFSNNNVAPIENLEAYTLPAILSVFCVKEQANEIMAILTTYIDKFKGLVQPVGDYFMMPTYSTPSQSEIMMVGQLAESIKITMYIEYSVSKNLMLTNDIIVKVDGIPLLLNEFGSGKRRSFDSDNVNNNQTLQAVVRAQELTFEFHCFVPDSALFLVDEMLSLSNLNTKHNLLLTIRDKSYNYQVMLSDGEIKGVKGGVLYCSLTFSIVDGKKGGKQ